MNIRPLHDRVIVRRKEEEKTSPGGIVIPDGKKKTDEFFGEVDIYYNSTEAEVYLENSVYDYIELKIKYQGCADAGLCYPPVFKTITVKKKVASSNLKKVSFFESQNAISESLNINSLINSYETTKASSGDRNSG